MLRKLERRGIETLSLRQLAAFEWLAAEKRAEEEQGERVRQLLLIDSHEEAGNFTPQRAKRLRLLVRGGRSISGRRLDGPNAEEWARKQRETQLALARDSLVFQNMRAADAAARRMQRRLLRGDEPAAFVRLAPEAVGPRPTDRTSRVPRMRRSTVRRQARSPGRSTGDDDPPSDLAVIPLSAFLEDVESWLGGGA